MNRTTGIINFAMLILLVLVSDFGWSSNPFIKFSTGYNFNRSARWNDADYGTPTGTPVYGTDYFAEGKSGESILCELSIGVPVSRKMDLAINLSHTPDTKFNGQVNYPTAGSNQPVTARIRTTALLISSQIYPLGRSEKPLNPFIGIHFGVGLNRTESVRMSFPELSIPHNFITPGGTHTGFIYGLSLGNTFQISKPMAIELKFICRFAGIAVTDSGIAKIERRHNTSLISVGSTETTLKQMGIRIGIQYGL